MAKLEQLFDNVVRAPDDDMHRLAYAAAVAATDPARAELIRVAVAHEKKPTPLKLKKLVKANAVRWCGDLTGVIADDWIAFRRGFLSTCLVGPNGASKYGGYPPGVARAALSRRVLASAQWQLVERVRWFSDSASLVALAHQLSRLTSLENVDVTEVSGLLAGGYLPRLERLSLFQYAQPGAVFRKVPASLRRLSVDTMAEGAVGPDLVPWLLESPLWEQLEELDMNYYAVSAVADWVNVLPKHGPLTRIECGAASLVRAKTGWELYVDASQQHMMSWLEHLPKKKVTRIVAAGANEPKRAAMAALAKKVGAELAFATKIAKRDRVVPWDIAW